jgi:hypothetical protein
MPGHCVLPVRLLLPARVVDCKSLALPCLGACIGVDTPLQGPSLRHDILAVDQEACFPWSAQAWRCSVAVLRFQRCSTLPLQALMVAREK